MKKYVLVLCLNYLLLTVLTIYADTDGKNLTAPVPQRARELASQSVELAERDRFRETVATLKKAMSIAPNFVNAHAEYIGLKANFMGRYDEVRAEYEALMKKSQTIRFTRWH